MIPYAIECGAVTERHLKVFEQVKQLVDGMNDGLTCHQVCEACAIVIKDVIHRRGHFLIHGIEHSWLEIREKCPCAPVIIDAYPVGGATGPFMVSTDSLLNPWELMYREDASAARDAA